MKKLLCTMLLAASGSAFADWSLDNNQSSLNFISTKNQHVSETHSFGVLSGTLNDAGKLSVKVTLDSVNTGIPIRDQRMKDILFKVADIPSATLKADIDSKLLKTPLGKSVQADIQAQFIVNDKSVTLPVSLQVTKLADDALLATTTKPVLLSAKDFALDSGVEALQKIAGLAGISLTVPVTFNVTFVAAK